MDAKADAESKQIAEEEFEEDHVVAACETCPGKTVFTERGNTDAWIATDLTVSLDR